MLHRRDSHERGLVIPRDCKSSVQREMQDVDDTLFLYLLPILLELTTVIRASLFPAELRSLGLVCGPRGSHILREDGLIALPNSLLRSRR